ncbi:unnamed protein product [Adineta steineri]|uniref:Uncharacterized protein n=1 Tax=Adineta steineri TaxID=433720 RepID=A0A814NBT4_9BILA|nr:unnamed protein product [Adineta steineri]
MDLSKHIYYPQGPNAYNLQQVYMQSFVPPSPFVHANDPQSMSPFIRIVRPPNQVPTGAPYYRSPYHMPQNIPQQTLAAQLSNQTQSSINQQYGTSSQSSQSQEKRIRQPLRIIDPVSQSTLELKTEIPSNDEDCQKDTVVDSTNTKSKLSDGTNKTQPQEDLQRQFARLLASDGQTDKTEHQRIDGVENKTRGESPP